MARLGSFAVVLAGILACSGPSSDGTGEIPPCDQECQDRTTARALRETMKLAFNLTLQGKPIGAYDVSTPCPLGGTAHVAGSVTSNAIQGTNEVMLTYTFDKCGYNVDEDTPANNYRMTLSGAITQQGTMAAQPTSTMALVMGSPEITFDGTVYTPPLPIQLKCPIAFGQNGGRLSGTVCGRDFTILL